MPPGDAINQPAQSWRNLLPLLAGLTALVFVGTAVWYLFVLQPPPSTHADFYKTITTQNPSFVEAETLATQRRFAEALPLYQDALQYATDDEQRLQIKLLIARMMVQTGAYAEAVPLLRQIISAAENPRTARGRSVAVEEIAEIYVRGIADINRKIVEEEPFKSLFVENRGAVTLRKFHEYAASIAPIAIAELWIAQWYAYQLPARDAQSKLSSDTVQAYKAEIADRLSAADSDIAYMTQEGTMDADLRYALVMRAVVVGILNRKGDISAGDAYEQFAAAIGAYQEAGPGQDCVPRYHYALFMAQTYGASKQDEIKMVLAPLSSDPYSKSGSCSFLKEGKNSVYFRPFPALIASIDPDFKAYLQTLGWAEEDFSL